MYGILNSPHSVDFVHPKSNGRMEVILICLFAILNIDQYASVVQLEIDVYCNSDGIFEDISKVLQIPTWHALKCIKTLLKRLVVSVLCSKRVFNINKNKINANRRKQGLITCFRPPHANEITPKQLRILLVSRIYGALP
jgi:hypothetical protein